MHFDYYMAVWEYLGGHMKDVIRAGKKIILFKKQTSKKPYWDIFSGLGGFLVLDLNKNTNYPLMFKSHPNLEIFFW